MLERQRRARINRCLDELKDLMAGALAAEHGEAGMAKLEKADVLELTVRHLHKLRRERRLAANPVVASDRFRAGFTQCAREVSVALAAIPGVDVTLGTRLMTHLGHALNGLDAPTTTTPLLTSTPVPTAITTALPIRSYSPPDSPDSITDAHELQQQTMCWRPESPLSSGYGSDTNAMERPSSKTSSTSSVWRPW